MRGKVRDVMTPAPVAMSAATPLRAAAEAMRDAQIGDVLVLDQEERLIGIVTDRDLVVRAMAAGADPQSTALGEIATALPVTVAPDEEASSVVELMRQHAVRRVPVVQGTDTVGIVSLGDLAVERDPTSALAEISFQHANN